MNRDGFPMKNRRPAMGFDFDPSRSGRHPGRQPRNNDFAGEFGPRGRGRGERRGGPRGRGRATRGDVRTAILLLLADEPMHGYQLMQAIGERSNGAWTPSPGAIYPVLSQLEDEALVSITIEAGRKVATLTEAGRNVADQLTGEGRDPFSQGSPQNGPDLRLLMHSLSEAVRQVARTGTETQREQAAALLTETRRSLYLMLAESPEA